MENLNSSKNIALVASAGTGKTFNLSLRYINLLLNGAQMEQILCLTFTVKATAEMQERIIKVLNALADKDRASFKGERAILRDFNSLTDDELEEKARPVRDYVLKHFSLMRIRTIDSFINRIISQFPFEANVRPGFTIIQDKEKEELDAEAFSASYRIFTAILGDSLRNAARALNQSPKSLMEELRKHQPAFENQLISLPLLSEIYSLSPLTLDTLADELGKAAIACTDASKAFGLALQETKLNGHQVKQANGFAEGKDIAGIMATQLYLNQDPYSGHFKKFEYTAIQEKLYYEVIGHLSNYLKISGEIKVRLAVQFFSIFFKELEQIKKQRNILTFADITMKAYSMLVDNKIFEDTEYLYFRLDGRILHILIDEFQDTSLAQWKILEPLIQQALAGVGQQDSIKSFFYVGDPKQTLYRFRGGESRLFNTVTDSYSDFITQEELNENYRSSKAVMNFVNDLFSRLKDDTFQFSEQKCMSNDSGYVGLKPIEEDGRDEFVIESVTDLLSRGFRPSEIAVLTSTNNDADYLTELLKESSIPARSETNQKISTTAPFTVVEAIFCHIFWSDKLNLCTYLMTEPAVASAYQMASSEFMTNTAEQIKTFADEINGLNGQAAFSKLVNTFYLAERFDNDPNFKKLCDLALSVSPTANLPEFFEELKRKADSQNALSSGKSDAVTVMTIHKSKGLEFEAVILADLERKTRPDAKHTRIVFYSVDESMLTDSILYNHGDKLNVFMDDDFHTAYNAEERATYYDSLNQLYVALTRAKRELYIPVKNEPTMNTLERLIFDNVEIGKEYGEKLKKSMLEEPENRSRKVIKFAVQQQPEYPITEESEDFTGEIFGSALHEAIFLAHSFSISEIGITVDFVIKRFSPYLGEIEADLIKKSLNVLYTHPKFIEVVQDADIYRERSFFDGDGIKTVDFYTVTTEKIYCLDFKTGNITKSAKEKYTDQINAYAEILTKLYGKPVEKYLVNFVSGACEWIEIS
jgi:exodeoxyribonuclease V beta subunit